MVDDGIEAAIAGLRHEVSLVVQGLSQMLATQQVHTELLRTVVEAAGSPVGEAHDLAESLLRIAGALKTQAETLGAIRTGIEKLPSEVGAALAPRQPPRA